MSLFKIPKQLFGTYNQVRKNVRCLRSRDLSFIEGFIDQLPDPGNLVAIGPSQKIVLADWYSTRSIGNGCFPYLVSDFILFEESVKTSEIVHWYKEKVLLPSTPLWFLLTAIAFAGSMQTLVYDDSSWCKKLLEVIICHWDDFLSIGNCCCTNVEDVIDAQESGNIISAC